MLLRVLSAAIGIPLAVAIVFARDPIVLTVAVAVLSVIGVHEFYRGVRKLGVKPIEWLGWLACILFVVDAGRAGNSDLTMRSSAPVSLLLLLGLVVELFRRRRSPIRNTGATVLGALYAGWLFSFIVALRTHGNSLLGYDPGTYVPPLFDFQSPGSLLVMFTLVTVWACDIGAYITGRAFGKHKLARSLSPGKTIEGAIGGVLFSVAASLVAGAILYLHFDVTMRIALGLIIGTVAILGDLVESAMKREIGIKDFGAIMPGHGGILDRFDSLLFVAPAVYYFLIVLGSRF